MKSQFVRAASVLALTVVFTVGLTFATVELPHLVDGFLQGAIRTPGGDSHADVVARLKTELFMAHYHIRTVGYLAFFVLLGLIVLGFSTERTGLATLGAVGVMLPVFAQFAGVMFFLAGLGLLNVVWLPILDVSHQMQSWGRVIDAPNDFLQWLLGLVGVHSVWPTAVLFTGGGILIFLLGVHAWLQARARGKVVADSWVYRLSRHPQYLGWILWTYGAYLLLQRMQYPRRSWGIGASLPWLISTMVIVGVAMAEEVGMGKRHGEEYEAYRRRAPLLVPLPRIVVRILAAPCRLFFGKARPERRREVVAVVGLYTALLMSISVTFYAGGLKVAVARLASPRDGTETMQRLVSEATSEANWRRQSHLLEEVASFGEPAVDPLVGLLEGADPALRSMAARLLGQLSSPRAVPALSAALGDPDENVRYRAAEALGAIGAPEATPSLVPLLGDPSAPVRVTAMASLAAIGSPRVLEEAPTFLGSSEAWIRGSAVQSLGMPGLEKALPILSARLDDESPDVRREVVVAILRIGSPRGTPILERALQDEDWEVRVYAAEARDRLRRRPP